MVIHLIDGTYELFRHFYGSSPREGRRPAVRRGDRRPALACCRWSRTGATHLGVATDHVIESFRNDLWPGYKTGAGIEPALLAQFHPLEEALAAMGVAVWPMVELEADDALASAARIAAPTTTSRRSASGRPTRIWRSACAATASCRSTAGRSPIRDDAGVRREVRRRAGADPRLPRARRRRGGRLSGHPRHRRRHRRAPRERARRDRGLSARGARASSRELALLFKDLATLRTDAELFPSTDALRWRGPTSAWAACADELGDDRLLDRCRAAHVA